MGYFRSCCLNNIIITVSLFELNWYFEKVKYKKAFMVFKSLIELAPDCFWRTNWICKMLKININTNYTFQNQRPIVWIIKLHKYGITCLHKETIPNRRNSLKINCIVLFFASSLEIFWALIYLLSHAYQNENM